MARGITKITTGLFFLLAISLQACKPVEEAVVVDHGSAPSTSERLIGTVRNDSGCGYVIDVTQGDVMKSYYPVNLEDKYKKEGMRLKFAWSKSLNEMTGDCSYLIPIEISDVTPMR